MVKSTIGFVDGNNWYHNVKNLIKPGKIDISKLINFICSQKNYKLKEIRWYKSRK